MAKSKKLSQSKINRFAEAFKARQGEALAAEGRASEDRLILARFGTDALADFRNRRDSK